jgi:hypothetical protein
MCRKSQDLTPPKTADSQLFPPWRTYDCNFRFFCSVKNVKKMPIPNFFYFLELKNF